MKAVKVQATLGMPAGQGKSALVIIGKHDDGKWHYESDRSLFGFFQNQLRNL